MFAEELVRVASAPTAIGCGCAHPCQGRLDLARLDEAVPDWRERQTWACGPGAMLDGAERVWAGRGDRRPAHLERFAVSRGRGARQGGTVSSRAAGRRRRGRRDVADGRRRGSGVQMPFGCRMGICQSCVVGLSTGMSAICAPVPNTNRGVGCRPASPRLRAIACSTSRVYWVVTYAIVGYGSVGNERRLTDGNHRRSGVLHI